MNKESIFNCIVDPDYADTHHKEARIGADAWHLLASLSNGNLDINGSIDQASIDELEIAIDLAMAGCEVIE